MSQFNLFTNPLSHSAIHGIYSLTHSFCLLLATTHHYIFLNVGGNDDDGNNIDDMKNIIVKIKLTFERSLPKGHDVSILFYLL